ncbi:MAG: peptidoglycan DD-metalloendopeptidase family protein [Succiniclasticum sp.]|jgi:murein DD-endopeptidase MepM/ murein hydrolase activator NlpD|nr:peptidoglycan DD-metalloendopeptidase family protein [Succiniclasticum sp.]MEE3479815.1 peptidoglycan DD-metalloendopeptidase family protein [Succiniclasticum sp.]
MKVHKLTAAVLAAWLTVLQVAPPLTLSFVPMASVYAADIDEKRKELESAQEKAQQAKQRSEKAGQSVQLAKNRLGEVMAQLHQLQTEIAALEKKASNLQKDIDKNTAILNQKKKEMEARMKIYKARLRDIYEHGQINYLDVLLGAKDFGDFASRMYLLQKIIRSDLALVETVQREAAEIQSRQDILNKQMEEIKKDKAALDEKKAALDKVRAERAQLLYKAEEEKRSSESEYQRMLAVSENIKAMIQSMEAASSMPAGGGSGAFMWPCSGPITSYYGWRTHPIFRTKRYHSGMDIAVDTGTPIHAAASGTVIYSGWMGGYGYCVMISHGGGLVSLYGHNSSLAVGEGQRVSQGQVIAYAGSTGYSTGPHCHFEVRVHGEVTDPLNYLP